MKSLLCGFGTVARTFSFCDPSAYCWDVSRGGGGVGDTLLFLAVGMNRKRDFQGKGKREMSLRSERPPVISGKSQMPTGSRCKPWGN